MQLVFITGASSGIGQALAARWPDTSVVADLPDLAAFFTRHGFKTWKRELEQTLGKPAKSTAPARAAKPRTSPAGGDLFDLPAEPDPDLPDAPSDLRYEAVLDWGALDRWLDKIQRADLTALDRARTVAV